MNKMFFGFALAPIMDEFFVDFIERSFISSNFSGVF